MMPSMPSRKAGWAANAIIGAFLGRRKTSSYAPVAISEDFGTIMARMKTNKAAIEKRQADLLKERYDLSNRPAKGVTMSRGKAVQEGVRVRLPKGATWDALAAMSPDEIRDKDAFPAGFLPLPHPNHPEGGMVFPSSTSTRSRNRKAATSPASTWTSTCPITSSRSSRPHLPHDASGSR